MDSYSKWKRGTFKLRSANCGRSGQERVSDFAKLTKDKLVQISKTPPCK